MCFIRNKVASYYPHADRGAATAANSIRHNLSVKGCSQEDNICWGSRVLNLDMILGRHAFSCNVCQHCGGHRAILRNSRAHCLHCACAPCRLAWYVAGQHAIDGIDNKIVVAKARRAAAFPHIRDKRYHIRRFGQMPARCMHEDIEWVWQYQRQWQQQLGHAQRAQQQDSAGAPMQLTSTIA